MNDTEHRVNWRELDSTTEAGRRALDVEIARRVGKKVTVTPRDENGYLVWQENQRHQLVYLDEWYDSETTETWGIGLPIPEYTTDLNAAASLPIRSDRGYMELRRWDDGMTEARVIDSLTWQTNYPEHYREMLPALAWCKAWLAWHDAKSANLSHPDTDESEDE